MVFQPFEGGLHGLLGASGDYIDAPVFGSFSDFLREVLLCGRNLLPSHPSIIQRTVELFSADVQEVWDVPLLDVLECEVAAVLLVVELAPEAHRLSEHSVEVDCDPHLTLIFASLGMVKGFSRKLELFEEAFVEEASEDVGVAEALPPVECVVDSVVEVDADGVEEGFVGIVLEEFEDLDLC